MNNKHFYIIISFASLMAALIEPRDYQAMMMTLKIFMCGGAFYYVGFHFREKLKFSFLLPLMIAIGVLANPIVPFNLGVGVRLMIDLVAAFAFYWVGLKAGKIQTGTIQKEEQSSSDTEHDGTEMK